MFPAFGALTSLTGGGSLTPSSTSGAATSGTGPVNVGGIDFGPAPGAQLGTLLTGGALVLAGLWLARRLL